MDQASVNNKWIRLVYFSGPVMTFRTGFSPIVGPLKYTRFCKVREKKLMYFIFSKFGSTEVHKVLQSEKKKLVYFSGSLNMKIFVLKDNNFHFMSPLKHTRFFKVREKKLMYFSGSTKQKPLALKAISGPLKYTSLIH